MADRYEDLKNEIALFKATVFKDISDFIAEMDAKIDKAHTDENLDFLITEFKKVNARLDKIDKNLGVETAT